MIKLLSINVLDPGMRAPGSTSRSQFFSSVGPEHYEISYDPHTGLVGVRRGPQAVAVHVSRVIDIVFMPDEPPTKPEGKPLKAA
jgi:hypothetical protein